ncbi:LamG-like jellyroll fold domain-containing protein [Thermodesulfobacteriota bacterium]
MDSDNTNRLKKIVDRLSPEDGKYICRVIYKDPFTDTYPILLIIYIFILGGFLLWPFDFLSWARNDARWMKNSNGIEFLKIGQAVSNSSTREFFDRLVKRGSITVEVWLETGDIDQSGLARIFSYSKNKKLCNFTIGQAWDKLVIRFRTTKTNLKGKSPHLVINDVFNSRTLQHIVIMYNLSEQRVYINGELKARSNVLKGDLSNWDPFCRLVIGNEATGDRSWKGKIYYVAVFDRVFTEQEIHNNYLSEFQSKVNTRPRVLRRKGSTKDTDLKTKGPLLRYLFDERKGNVIHDTGSVLSPVNLIIPEYIRPTNKPFLDFSSDYLHSKSQFSDIILNILIFIPLGMLIHGMLRIRYRLALKISLATLLAGILFSLSVESLQHFSMTRDSSLIDVSTNMTGVAIGIMIDRFYNLFLNYQAERLQRFMYDPTE